MQRPSVPLQNGALFVHSSSLVHGPDCAVRPAPPSCPSPPIERVSGSRSMVFGSDVHAEAIATGRASRSARATEVRARTVFCSRKSCIAGPLVLRPCCDVPGFVAGHPARVLAQILPCFRCRRLPGARSRERPEPLHLRVLGEGGSGVTR